MAFATTTDVEVAIAAARAGADVVLRNYGGGDSRQAKTDTDFATGTDLEAERAILAILAEHRPEDARTGEEFGATGAAE